MRYSRHLNDHSRTGSTRQQALRTAESGPSAPPADDEGTRQADSVTPSASKLKYVDHESFADSATDGRLWGPDRPEIPVPHYGLMPEVGVDSVAARRKPFALSRKDERVLFLRYNYAKFRLSRLAEQTESLSAEDAREQRRIWRERARQVQEKLVHANLPLVPAMARSLESPGPEFGELMSVGYAAVLRCIETFDIARGFKFSTYACRAILSAFRRLSGKARKHRSRFPVPFDPAMEQSDEVDRRHHRQRQNAIDALRVALRQNLAELSEKELQVLHERYIASDGRRPRTLPDVGEAVGLSKERVRQLEKRSLAKLRAVIEKQLAA